jgi:hypothetical protein
VVEVEGLCRGAAVLVQLQIKLELVDLAAVLAVVVEQELGSRGTRVTTTQET